MATIANLQILLSARADSLTRATRQGVESLRAFVNRAEAMKELKVNFNANVDQVRAGLIQGQRLIQNWLRTPAGLQLRAKVDDGLDRVRGTVIQARRMMLGISRTPIAVSVSAKMEQAKARFADLRRSSASWPIVVKGETAIDNLAMKWLTVRKTVDSTVVRANALKNIALIRFDKMMGKVGLKNILPFNGSDVMKSLQPVLGLAKSGVRVPLALATEGITKGIGVAGTIGRSLGSATVAAGALLGVVAAIGTVGAAAGMAAISTVAAVADRVDKTYTLAQAVGSSTTNFMGLAKAAEQINDVPMEGMNTALMVMRRNLADAAIAGKGSAEELSKLGLNAEAMSSAGADENFLQIADALSRVENSAEQATIAQGIFGKGGLALLPMLQQGRENLQGMIDKQHELGVALSEVDAANLSALQSGFDDVASRTEGATNAFALGLMPAVQMTLDAINKYAPGFETIRTATGTMARFVIGVLGSFADAWDNIKLVAMMAAQKIGGVLQNILDTAKSIVGAIESALAAVGIKVDLNAINDNASGAIAAMQLGLQEQIDAIASKPAAAKTWVASYDSLVAEMQQKGEELAEAARQSQGARLFADSLATSADTVQKTVDAMKQRAAGVGMDEGQKALADLANQQAKLQQMRDQIMVSMKGTADPKQLESYAGRLKQIDIAINFVPKGVAEVKQAIADINQAEITKSIDDAAKRVEQMRSGLTPEAFGLKDKSATSEQIDRFKELQGQATALEEAARIREEFRTDADKLADRMAQIQAAAEADPSIAPDVIQRAIDKARTDYAAGEQGTDGTMAKLAAAVERRSGNGLVNTDKPAETLAKQQVAEAKKQTQALGVISSSLTKNTLAVISLENA